MVIQWENIIHATMVQVYVKLYYFVITENDLSPNDLWEEMMELYDELDPKNNRNKICCNTIFECTNFLYPSSWFC